MSNISIGIKNSTAKILSVKNNFSIFFYIGLAILLFFEFLVLQDLLKVVLESAKDQLPSHSVQRVRINFADYDQNLKKVEDAQNFEADISPPQNPFKSK
jgi:hypothetical protein